MTKSEIDGHLGPSELRSAVPDASKELKATSRETTGELQDTIREIGLARFVGRVNAGLISGDRGYDAIEQFVTTERQRPLLSKVSEFVLGRPDPYQRKIG